MKYVGVAGALLLGVALVSAPVAAAQEQAQPSDEQKVKAAIQQAMDATEAILFRPGPQAADWNKGGLDLRAAVAAKPGGLAQNYVVNVDKDGETSLSIYTSAPAATYVPKDWKRLWRFGDVDAADPDGFLDIGNVDGPYYYVVRGASKRVGDAYCTSAPVGGEVYQAPGSESTDVPAGMVLLMFEAALQMTSKHRICEKYEAKGKAYSVRYFLDGGRSLPALDEAGDELNIIPAVPIGEVLKPKAR